MKVEEKDKKKAYEKPKLRIIKLEAEEVLAAGCKTGEAMTLAIGGMPFCGIANNCITHAS